MASSEWEIVQEEFACEHEETEFRRMTMSDGRPLFVVQCLECGHNKGSVRKASIPGIQLLNMQPFDEGLRQRWQDCRMARLEELRQAKNREWWDEYDAYLRSPEWQAKRRAVLERDEHLCQGCRKQLANQVHHLTYERKCREMLFDLVSVCDDCHSSIHAPKGGLNGA